MTSLLAAAFEPRATAAALGALFTGLGSLIGAILSNRSQKAKSVDICDQRIKEIIDAFYRGVKLKDLIEEEDNKWSGLP